MTEELTGYVRPDGRWGIRNRLLVIYTVECASFVAQHVADMMRDPDVECIGFRGCTDNAYAVHLLISMIRHPNVGGVLAIGLGCEYVQAEWLEEVAQKAGKPAAWFSIQETGGTGPSIQKGLQLATSLLQIIRRQQRQPMPVSALAIGAECGGSDWTSGLAGNAVVGSFFDQLVEKGGSAVFEEIVEAVGLRDFLTSRGIDDQAKEDIGFTYDKAMQYCKDVHQYSISPGNFDGGLTTIEEKSMGALVKSGSKPMQGVLKVGNDIPHAGLWLLDSTPDPHFMEFGITNPNDSEGLSDLISVGCQLVFLVTGRGSVIGSAVSPTLKITGNADTYRRMIGDMDFNAGELLEGTHTLDTLAQALWKNVKRVVNGEPTKSEQMGHKEYFIPYKYQERTVVRCRH